MNSGVRSLRKCFEIPKKRSFMDTDFLLASRQEKAVPGNCSFLAIPQMGDTMSRCREDKARDTDWLSEHWKLEMMKEIDNE